MCKKFSRKYLRKIEKARTKANYKALQNARGKGLEGATNICSAVLMEGEKSKHSKAIMTRSGAVGRQGGELLGYVEGDMPWAGLVPGRPDYPFLNCAEAKAYLEILARHESPNRYRITSFTSNGLVNPPCPNCRLWVYETFGDVVDH
jgi:hypothetical protein